MTDTGRCHCQLIQIDTVCPNLLGGVLHGSFQAAAPFGRMDAHDGKIEIPVAGGLYKRRAVFSQDGIFCCKSARRIVLGVGNPGIDVKGNVTSFVPDCADGFAKFFLRTQILVGTVLGKTVVKSVVMPACQQQMIETHFPGLVQKAGNILVPMDNAAVLVFKIVMGHKAGTFFKPFWPLWLGNG